MVASVVEVLCRLENLVSILVVLFRVLDWVVMVALAMECCWVCWVFLIVSFLGYGCCGDFVVLGLGVLSWISILVSAAMPLLGEAWGHC